MSTTVKLHPDVYPHHCTSPNHILLRAFTISIAMVHGAENALDRGDFTCRLEKRRPVYMGDREMLHNLLSTSREGGT